jgi:hypothetical protein
VNAELPEHMARVSIRDMVVGEEAYTVPWSVQVDQNGQCWIRGDYNFTHQPFGTSQMPITRTSGGYEVRTSPGTQYEQTQLSPDTREQMGLLPITKIK